MVWCAMMWCMVHHVVWCGVVRRAPRTAFIQPGTPCSCTSVYPLDTACTVPVSELRRHLCAQLRRSQPAAA